MWKKEDEINPTPGVRERERQGIGNGPAAATAATGERATIGRSITIKGEVTGDEDLLIQGHVDGSVTLKQQAVTVGREGQVKADITGRIVTVEGEVEGNLTADEQVILRSSARVQGDIIAPRVVLEDGANFRGGIDMGDPQARGKSATFNPPASEKKKSEASQALPDTSKAEAESKKEGSDSVSKTGA